MIQNTSLVSTPLTLEETKNSLNTFLNNNRCIADSKISSKELQVMLKGFRQPKCDILLYAGWLKRLVKHIKDCSVIDEQITGIGDCLVNNYDILYSIIKKKGSLRKYYKQITNFLYLLHLKSTLKESPYLETSKKWTHKWSRLDLSNEEKAKYYLRSARIYHAEGNQRSIGKTLRKGLELSPQNTKLLKLQEIHEKPRPKRKIMIDNSQFYYELGKKNEAKRKKCNE